jgi:hypothetical protein
MREGREAKSKKRGALIIVDEARFRGLGTRELVPIRV